jgi:signal transduction histidine kinase
VIAIENVRLFNETKEALDQQTATAEVLQAISSSPGDLQPVFDTLVRAAAKFCGAPEVLIERLDNDVLRCAAGIGTHAEGLKRGFGSLEAAQVPLTKGSVAGRAVLERRSVYVHDLAAESEEEYPEGRMLQRHTGSRTMVATPLLREGVALGAILLIRTDVKPFSDKQLQLLRIFADQAVIAIENVRLFKELETRNRDLTEALEQQTATSEILRVISQSQTDVQPVFDTIAASALKLCSATSAVVTTFDGELIRVGGLANVSPEGADAVRGRYPRPPGRYNAASRAVLMRSLVTIPDVLEDPEYEIRAPLITAGFRSIVAVPLLREGNPLGAITVVRPDPGPFPEKQIALLQTFADQAVIAIENARLFKELETRNRDLTEALEQQTATSDILRVISQSQTDVQPVFDTIAMAALKLCRATSANVFTFDGELVHLAAFVNVDPAYIDAMRRLYPRPLSRDTAVLRAIQTRSVVVIPDVLQDKDYLSALGSRATAGRFRSVLAVPLMREGNAIGGIAVGRAESGPFPNAQVALLETFADQAVIAIENARLFKELEARTAELTQSVGELRALGEVGQAVSSTLDLETVLRTIVSRATHLAGMDGGSIYEYDEAHEQFYLHTVDRLPDELVDALRAAPIPKGEGALGRMAVTGEPVQIRDVADESVYQSRVREILIRLGYRAVLAVPLLRDDHLLGGLVVNRSSAGEFAPQVIELLKTFATQSALAIQNARLFREIEVKSRELETASRHKSEFLANMSHELRTPLNAIIGFSEVLAERMFGEVNEKQAEYLGDILESGRHLLSLINDILDLSKIEAGRMELEPSDFDLPTAIENTLTLVRERAQRRTITLRRTVDDRLGTIHGDERKVKQVLLNLLSNALKFTPEGGEINVRAEMRDGTAEISVTDTGVGIAPEDQEAVFEEFRQVGTAARKVEGTGLGLAISRKFIELHGGRISVTSQVGSGSTFTFWLPLGFGGHRQTG